MSTGSYVISSHLFCQIQLYEDFARSRAKKSVVDSLQVEQPAAASNVHIFQVCVSVIVM